MIVPLSISSGLIFYIIHTNTGMTMTVIKTVEMTMCYSFCHPKYKQIKDDGDDDTDGSGDVYTYDDEDKSKLMMMMSMVVGMMMILMMVMMMLMMMRRMVVAMYINSVVALQGLLLSLFHSFSTVAHFSQL